MTDPDATLVIANVKGEGYPECDWDFAAWAGHLKITANCPAANITFSGRQLDALKRMIAHAQGEPQRKERG